jgi:TolA-binding protein
MKRTAVIVILVILLLLSAGTNTFLYLQGTKNGEKSKSELAIMNQKDSLQKELLRLEDSLNNVVKNLQTENQTLTTKVGDLESDKNPKILMAYREINKLRRLLLNSSSSSSSSSTTESTSTSSSSGTSSFGTGKKGNMDELRRQLAEAKKRITLLTSQIDSLTNQKTKLVADLENETNAKRVFESENIELKQRLEKGALPQFGTLITMSYNAKGDEVYKAAKIDRFKITFDVLENPMVTTPVDEEVTIRILAPNGVVLSSTNKTLQDVSTISTLKQTISFDGALQKVKWAYPGSKGSLVGKLNKGRYITELWTRGLLRQKNSFELE